MTLLVSILTYIYGGNEFLIFHDLRTAQLGLLFFFGGFFYINREAIPFSPIVLVGLGFITYLAKDSSSVLLFKGVFFSYLVLILALHPKLRLPSIDKHGDISYGLYIYAFPIQQLIALFITGITPLYMFILSSVITFSLAIISWRLIEKPALSLKGRISLVIFKKYELTTKA